MDRDSAWQRVLAATDGHNIDTISVHLDDAKSWTYITCTCGLPETFTEQWEFTDHIRRLVFDALLGPDAMADAMADPETPSDG